MIINIILLLLGFGLLIKGTDFFVDGASSTNQNFKVSKMLIGLTIIGSNIFNICVVLEIPIAIYGTITPVSFQIIDLIILIASSILLFIFATTKRTITKIEGSLMLLTFTIYYILVFIL